MIYTYNDALEYIFKEELIVDYSLNSIRRGLIACGNPEKTFKIIHIAGTNGKWSVSKMIFSILKESQKHVGVFTSPHLIDIKERFETEAGDISEKDFISILNRIQLLEIALSYFDICVLLACIYFQKQNCEYVILEVGVWGRLDTTNIVHPIITAITSISLDHQHLLWNTIEKISAEKAGIIKPSIPVVLNHKNTVIENYAKNIKAPLIYTDRLVKTNLLWKFQQKNAAIAYEITKYLGINPQIIMKGLQKVKHEGRLQFLQSNIIIDGAHNEESLKVLQQFIDTKIQKDFDNIYYCFSLKKWKDINLVVHTLGKHNNFILLDISNSMLENLSRYSDQYPLESKEYILRSANENPKDLYVIFGSLYMIGEFMKK